MTDFVVAIIATYGRPKELSRLLASLEEIKESLGAVIVVDNAGATEVQTLVGKAKCNTHYFSPKKNLGCGGGLHFGHEKAFGLFGNKLTHLWILDDDTVVPPNAIDGMTREMRNESAEAACPMITDGSGHIRWFPGLLDTKAFQMIRDLTTPAEYIACCGIQPIPFNWSTGVSLLISKRVVVELGCHRSDYWVRGEDLEFSLRITSKFKAIFVPSITVQHIQVDDLSIRKNSKEEYLKNAAMLQNQWYTSLYLPHGRSLIYSLPGNYLRFLKTWSWLALLDGFRAFYLGGMIGKPAGAEKGDFFRKRDEAMRL